LPTPAINDWVVSAVLRVADVPRRMATEPLDGEVGRERVDAQFGEGTDLFGGMDHPQGEALFGAHLGDVEPATVLQSNPQGDGAPARAEGGGGHHVVPPDPAAPGQVADQPEVTAVEADELAPPLDAGHPLSDHLVERRLDRLEGGERVELAPVDPQSGHPAGELDRQGFDLGEFGHRSIVDPRRP
jgi:hypothetical protein